MPKNKSLKKIEKLFRGARSVHLFAQFLHKGADAGFGFAESRDARRGMRGGGGGGGVQWTKAGKALMYAMETENMTGKQKIEAAGFLAGWLDKVSVGCLVVGLFQPEHMVGGMVGSIACFGVALGIKIRSAQ